MDRVSAKPANPMFLEGAIMLLPIGPMPYITNFPRAPLLRSRDGRMHPTTAVGLTIGFSLVAVVVAILVYLWCWHRHHRRPRRQNRNHQGGGGGGSGPTEAVGVANNAIPPQDRQMADINIHRHNDHHFHRHNHYHGPHHHNHNHNYQGHNHHGHNHHRHKHHHGRHHHHHHHRFRHAKRWFLHYRDPLADPDDLLRQPPQPIAEIPLAPNPADMAAPQLNQNDDQNPLDMLDQVLENAHEARRHRREGRRVRHHHGCAGRHHHRRSGGID